MKKSLLILVSFIICLFFTSCKNDKPTESKQNIEQNSQVKITSSETQKNYVDMDASENKFAGNWQAEIITGFSDAGYEYGTEELLLKPNGEAIYKNFEGNWKFEKNDNSIHMNGAIKDGAVSVKSEIILKVIDKEGRTVLLLDDNDDKFDKEFYLQ